MKLNALFTDFGKKVNFDLKNEKLKDLLASEMDIPEEFAEALLKGLMNESAAKNKLMPGIRAEVYNGIDSDIEELLTEMGLDDNTAKTVKDQKKTVDKLKTLATHYKAEAEKASKKGNSEEATALRKQVEELNNQIKTVKADSQKTIDQLKTDNETSLTGFSLKSLLSTKQYTLPEQMDAEEKINTVYSIVNQELQNKGYKLVRQNGSLAIQKQDGTEAYDEKNNKLELPSFLDGALAQRGLLKQSDPAKPPAKDPATHIPGQTQASIPAAVSNALSEIDKQIAEVSNRD